MGINTHKVLRHLMLLAIALVAMFALSLSAVGAQDATPTQAPQHDPADTYDATKALLTGQVYDDSFEQNGITFTLKADDPKVLILNGGMFSNSPINVPDQVIGIGFASANTMYVAMRNSVAVYNTENGGFTPAIADAKILPAGLSLYAYKSDECLLAFKSGLDTPIGVKIVSGTGSGYNITIHYDVASNCLATPTQYAEFLKYTLASSDVYPSDMATDGAYNDKELMEAVPAFVLDKPLVLDAFTFTMKPENPTSVFVQGGGLIAEHPVDSRVLQVGGGDNKIYILAQGSLTTLQSDTNLTVMNRADAKGGNTLADGLTVYNIIKECVYGFMAGKAWPVGYKLGINGPYILIEDPTCVAPREVKVAWAIHVAAIRAVTVEMMAKD